ncbi:MAG TPA: LysM peptidoglycan-binding domain-containing protein [Anaerolineae bacterium]|nr:LysM peptidoglycan-binding domain-containing protein [Anaerolineae bacterium]
MKRLLFIILIVVVLAGALAAPAAASGNAQTVSYVVKPDDTLSSIARQFCTTWQQIYHINRAVIGPNPNVLRAGTVLQVPNQCSVQTPPPGGCNLGPIPHAMGPLNGNIYTVVAGDTLFSIARRFCTTVNFLATTNGIPHPARIYVGQRLAVPVGTTPTPTPTPPAQRYLTMAFPTNGAVLPGTWTATGTGAGLFEGNVVVTAFTNANVQIAQQPTTLQGANVGTGGPGNWSVTLTTNVAPGTPGYVIASSPQSNVQPVRANVTYGQQPAGPTIAITSPSPNITLPRTFNVIGTASGLQPGFVVVQALSRDGTVLFSEASVAVPGGSGTWNVALTVPVSSATDGQIVAFWSQNTSVRATILVRFSGV